MRSSDAARRLPVPGWDDACEWTGTVPFASLPRTVDPEAGFVMTANNAITDADEPYISYTFSQPWRAERLRSLLADAPPLSVDELAGMQADTVSLQARGWGRLLTGLGPFENEDAEAARALLAGLDGNLAAGSAAALLYACFLRALAEALYRPVLGAKTWAWMTSGALAPTLSMMRRWLGNDTWELLGGPVPPDAGQRTADQRERVLAAVPARARRGVGRGGQGRRARPRAVAVGRPAPRGAGAPARRGDVPRRGDGRRRRHHPGGRLRVAAGQPVHGDQPVGVPAGGGPRRPRRPRASSSLAARPATRPARTSPTSSHAGPSTSGSR